ncbi:MAG: FtsX-like permease family protein, partial [Dehalococcoidia bacterium]
LVPSRPLDPSGYDTTRQRVEARTGDTLGGLVDEQVAHIKTPALPLSLPPISRFASSLDMRGSVQSYSGSELHSNVLEGRFPDAGVAGEAEGRAIEAAIGRSSADFLEVGVGDTLGVVPIGGDPTRTLSLTVVGILEANDITEQYWTFTIDPFTIQVDQSTGVELPLLPIIISPESFIADVAASFHGMVVDYWWFFYVDPSRIEAREARDLQQAMVSLETDLGADLPGSLVLSGLGDTLSRYQDKLFFSRIPVLIMLMVVVAIVLYYLIMVANVVVDRHLAEIALFRSRGANSLQVMAVYLWEAFFLSVAAAVLGPLLAHLLVPLLGQAPAFSEVTGGASLPTTLTASAFWYALLGAGLSFLALFIPALKGASFNPLDARAIASRPALTSFFHKYFLDLFLLVLAGILYWELTQRGTLVTRRLFGTDSVDQVLLIAPAIFMLSLALVILRALPWLLRFLGYVASYSRRTWLVMGLWDLGRNPVHYLRPTLLLMLVAGMAMFAASYTHTVEQSFRDRGLFATGSDVRLVGLPSFVSSPKEELTAGFEERPGVARASAVYRFEPQFGASSSRSFDLLAVDSIRFNRVSFFREDFSETDRFTLYRQLDRGRSLLRGRDLPQDATALGIWVRPAQTKPNVSLWMQVRDQGGRSWRYRLGRLDFEEWRFLRTDLVDFSGNPLPGPLVLQSLVLWELDFPGDPFPLNLITLGHTSSGSFNFSGLTAMTPDQPQGFVIDPMNRPEGWSVMATSALISETLKTDREVLRGEAPTLALKWPNSRGVGRRGILPGDLREPLPIVASDRFLAVTGRRVGDVVDITVAGIPMPVKIAGSVAFFPTMDPARAFVVGNLDTLLYYANLFRPGNPTLPNEVWLSLSDDPDERTAFLTDLRASAFRRYVSADSQSILNNLATDPLVGAGSSGILFAVLVVLVVVSIGGYLGYFYVSSYRSP